MNVWAPQTEDDFDRFWDHNARYEMDNIQQVALAEWIKDTGDKLTYTSGRSSGWLRENERYTHRNHSKRRQYIYIFRRASDDATNNSVEILAVYSSAEQWDVAVQRRPR
jgi:plasmid stabilization system protein ParE